MDGWMEGWDATPVSRGADALVSGWWSSFWPVRRDFLFLSCDSLLFTHLHFLAVLFLLLIVASL